MIRDAVENVYLTCQIIEFSSKEMLWGIYDDKGGMN